MTEQPPAKVPSGLLTFAGRLLALATLIIVGAGFYFFVMYVHDKVESGVMPSGSYPIPFLLIPGVLIALLFFVVGAFILERIGVRIWNTQRDRNDSA